MDELKTAYRIKTQVTLPATGMLAANGEVRVITTGTQAGLWLYGPTARWSMMAGFNTISLDSGVLAGAAVTLVGAIPAGSLLMGVTAQVTVAITGSATWDLGVTAATTRYGDNLAPALGTTCNIANYLAAFTAPIYHPAAMDVIITDDGANPFTGGRILIRLYTFTFPLPV